MLEASPMSERANASWLQDRRTAGQGRAYQQQWYDLWDKIFEQVQKPAVKQQSRERSETM